MNRLPAVGWLVSLPAESRIKARRGPIYREERTAIICNSVQKVLPLIIRHAADTMLGLSAILARLKLQLIACVHSAAAVFAVHVCIVSFAIHLSVTKTDEEVAAQRI